VPRSRTGTTAGTGTTAVPCRAKAGERQAGRSGGRRGSLIDGSRRGSGVVAYLREQGVERIDLMIATHPHEDHIGGLIQVLDAMPVARVVTK